MDTTIAALQKTPLPTILIFAGLLFILLGFVSKLGGIIEVSTEQKRWTIPVGLLVLAIGLVLSFVSSSKPDSSATRAEATVSAILPEPKAKPEEAAREPSKPPPPPPQVQDEAQKQKAAEMAAQKQAEQKAAEHRARWPNYDFPPPNAGLLVYTIMPDGNPACASYNGTACLWGQTYDKIDFGKINPLICGDDHYAKWHATGYENPKHWCNLAKSVTPNPS